MPKDRLKDVIYGRIVVDYWTQKEERHRRRLTVGGNFSCYSGDSSTPTSDITTAKLIINSTISTPGVMYMCCDIKCFYLEITLSRYEYIKIKIDIQTEEIILEYNLVNLSHNGYEYYDICKGMHGLPKEGILSNQQLVRKLETKGYSPCKQTLGLWRHKWRPIAFSLVVENFGVKYVDKKHVKHLINTTQENYQVSTEWEGKRYCGIIIKWNHQKHVFDLSMPSYTQATLHKF